MIWWTAKSKAPPKMAVSACSNRLSNILFKLTESKKLNIKHSFLQWGPESNRSLTCRPHSPQRRRFSVGKRHQCTLGLCKLQQCILGIGQSTAMCPRIVRTWKFKKLIHCETWMPGQSRIPMSASDVGKALQRGCTGSNRCQDQRICQKT